MIPKDFLAGIGGIVSSMAPTGAGATGASPTGAGPVDFGTDEAPQVEAEDSLLDYRPSELKPMNGFSAMTPLQQRTKIASGAVAGDGQFTTPDMRDYYKDVAFFSLLDPMGAPAPFDSVAPVERQYVTTVLGQDDPRDTEGFLRSLLRG